jgi:hypothetical protein
VTLLIGKVNRKDSTSIEKPFFMTKYVLDGDNYCVAWSRDRRITTSAGREFVYFNSEEAGIQFINRIIVSSTLTNALTPIEINFAEHIRRCVNKAYFTDAMQWELCLFEVENVEDFQGKEIFSTPYQIQYDIESEKLFVIKNTEGQFYGGINIGSIPAKVIWNTCTAGMIAQTVLIAECDIHKLVTNLRVNYGVKVVQIIELN